MAKKSKLLSDYVNDNHVTIPELIALLDDIQSKNFSDQSRQATDNARHLFVLGLNDINRLFPSLNVPTTSTDPADYINKWLNRYYNANSSKPSASVAKPKSSANDPALAILVKEHENYSEDELTNAVKAHNLFMSAENKSGTLLEEYIAEQSHNYGWIWAQGETLRACDFARNNPDIGINEFIQIKNRDNTENSSSSTVRDGTQIVKLERLKTRTKNGVPYADFEWDKINTAMSIPQNNKMSEASYIEFLRSVVNNNPDIIWG